MPFVHGALSRFASGTGNVAILLVGAKNWKEGPSGVRGFPVAVRPPAPGYDPGARARECDLSDETRTNGRVLKVNPEALDDVVEEKRAAHLSCIHSRHSKGTSIALHGLDDEVPKDLGGR